MESVIRTAWKTNLVFKVPHDANMSYTLVICLLHTFNPAFKTGTIFYKKSAALYRKHILERGGTAKPMELYRAFRGGEPSIDALLERDGISKK